MVDKNGLVKGWNNIGSYFLRFIMVVIVLIGIFGYSMFPIHIDEGILSTSPGSVAADDTLYIGNYIADRASAIGNNITIIEQSGSCNGTGNITTVAFWANSALDYVTVATYYLTDVDTLATRDFEYVGHVDAGSQQTAVVNLAVEEGDYLGMYIYNNDYMENDNADGSKHCWIISGNYTNTAGTIFTDTANRAISLQGWGNGILAVTDNTTEVGALTVTAGEKVINVYSFFEEDDNEDNSVVLEYKAAASGDWITGIALTVDRESTVYSGGSEIFNPYAKTYRGKIFGLTPNTAYNVRVTYSDTDGLSGTNPAVANITTRSDTYPLGNGTTYYVSDTGNDGNDGLSSGDGNAWLTVQFAADSVSAGDTVYLKGTFNESVNVTTAGTAGEPISFVGLPGQVATINTGNISTGFQITADYVTLRDFAITNSPRTVLLNDADYAVVDNMTISDFGYNDASGGGGVVLINNSDNCTVVSSNLTSERIYAADVNHGEAGVWIMAVGSAPGGAGTVIRNNYIAGTGNSTADGVGGADNMNRKDGPYKDTDIYDNVFFQLGDDCVEAEGGSMNLGVWGNTMTDSYICIGAATVVQGPAYIIKNVSDNMTSSFMKVGRNENTFYDGAMYIYHNSVYSPQTNSSATSPAGGTWQRNYTYRNNAYSVYAYPTYAADPSDNATFNNTWDYNIHDIIGGNLARWDATTYTDNSGNWTAFKAASGQETNGIYADPLFLDPASGNMTPDTGSPCTDNGTSIQGINDANSPWPYTGAAPDIGAYELSAEASPAGGTFTFMGIPSAVLIMGVTNPTYVMGK